MHDDDRLRLAELTPWQVAGLTAYLEARSEPVQGIVGVLYVIRNRGVHDEKAWAEVCFQPKQFSCWNDHDPNLPVGLLLGNQLRGTATGAPLAPRSDLVVLDTAIWLAEKVFSASVPDPTHGARHYHSTAIQKPTWATSDGARVSARIGHHVFYVGVV